MPLWGAYNQYIYIIQEREFIRLNEPTYKIGKTTKRMKRFNTYPKGSVVKLFLEVKDCNKFENKMIKLFDEKYYCQSNSELYSNGDIIFSKLKPKSSNAEVRHHFTTHSIQGETIESKIFIDISRMFNSRMFYSAIRFLVRPPVKVVALDGFNSN